MVKFRDSIIISSPRLAQDAKRRFARKSLCRLLLFSFILLLFQEYFMYQFTHSEITPKRKTLEVHTSFGKRDTITSMLSQANISTTRLPTRLPTHVPTHLPTHLLVQDAASHSARDGGAHADAKITAYVSPKSPTDVQARPFTDAVAHTAAAHLPALSLYLMPSPLPSFLPTRGTSMSKTTSSYLKREHLEPCASLPEWARGLDTELERHDMDPTHGDICRAKNGDFFCPNTCIFSNLRPFCFAANGVNPCRATIDPCAFPNLGTAEWALDLDIDLEEHDMEPMHGNVCRASNGEFYCPITCIFSSISPFCLAADGSAPCRVTMEKPSSTNSSIFDENDIKFTPSSPSAPLCAFPNNETASWARNLFVQLERHTSDSLHGDVCRAGNDGAFFCPKSCFISVEPPYCSASGGLSPCRVVSKVYYAEEVESKRNHEEQIHAEAQIKDVNPDYSHRNQNGQIVHEVSGPRSLISNGYKIKSIIDNAGRKMTINKNEYQPFSYTRSIVSPRTKHDPLPILVNVSEISKSTGFPFFFHVPTVAGTYVSNALESKRNLKTLPGDDPGALKYFEESQVIQKKIISYIKTSHFADACVFFSRTNIVVRAFTILREPVARIISLFQYARRSVLLDSDNETNFHLRNQSIEAFLHESNTTNWLVFNLASAVVPRKYEIVMGGEREFLAQHHEMLQDASFVLFEKVEYGFMDDMNAAMRLIFSKFGWTWDASATHELSAADNISDSQTRPNRRRFTSSIRKRSEISADFSIVPFLPRIAEANSLDRSLYFEARRRYDEKMSKSVIVRNTSIESLRGNASIKTQYRIKALHETIINCG